MKNSSKLLVFFTAGIIAALLFSMGFVSGRLSVSNSSARLASETGQDKDTFEPYTQAWNILNQNYIDQPIDPQVLIQGSIRGMLDELGDPYTNYIDPQTYAQENASLDGEYTGIGAWVDTSGERLVIISPMPDSPAENAGLLPGDVVVAIDGESMEGIDPTIVLDNILGPEDTTLIIAIEREGADDLLEFELKREIIGIDQNSFSQAKKITHPANQPDKAKSDEKIFFIVENMPEYEGGFYALGQYVTGMQEKIAKTENLKGEAYIGFTINPEGKVTDVKIMESDSEQIGEQAAKIVMNMADWEPGAQRGVAVPVDFAIEIVF